MLIVQDDMSLKSSGTSGTSDHSTASNPVQNGNILEAPPGPSTVWNHITTNIFHGDQSGPRKVGRVTPDGVGKDVDLRILKPLPKAAARKESLCKKTIRNCVGIRREKEEEKHWKTRRELFKMKNVENRNLKVPKKKDDIKKTSSK
ncbi:hypothetical protein JTB14_030862 [Gonioctena quinquepunctata]|nr:hypothetical protein JTB14_030862 [Gonioctena quinquepunctata]